MCFYLDLKETEVMWSFLGTYCKLRNAVQRDIRLAKEDYFKRKIAHDKGNSAKPWGHLKSLGYS